MFISLSGHQQSARSGFLSASAHCKHLNHRATQHSSGASYPNKEGHCNQSTRLNFRVRKIRSSERGLSLMSKNVTKLSVSTADIEMFFRLLEDSVVQAFLEKDKCRKYADKYLIAMVFTYFIRANYSWRQYNRYNFFVGLYLAHDMEEDEEEFKFETLPWLYGDAWRRRYPVLLRHRDALWRQIGYRAVVSRKCCEEVIAIRPHHPVWQRVRPDHHSGALREYATPDNYLGPFGPHRTAPACRLCNPDEELASDDSGVAYPPDSPAGASETDLSVPSAQMNLSDSLLCYEVMPK